MLGHRGCRLGITHQSITQMQARAAVNAASEVQAEGTPVHLEIMVPLVTMATEIEHQRRLIEEVAQHVRQHPVLRIGTMIETPRAAITASEIAEHAEFFSFGTNDLTQTVFAFSRDDAETFLPNYIESGILKDDPFQTLDTEVRCSPFFAYPSDRAPQLTPSSPLCDRVWASSCGWPSRTGAPSAPPSASASVANRAATSAACTSATRSVRALAPSRD